MMALALRVNDFLSGLFAGVGIKLVDFKIEFGRQYEGDMMRLIVAETCFRIHATFTQATALDISRRFNSATMFCRIFAMPEYDVRTIIACRGCNGVSYILLSGGPGELGCWGLWGES